MHFITDHQQFSEKASDIATILRPYIQFPDQVFLQTFVSFRVIKFDDLFDDFDFFQKIQALGKATGESVWTYCVLDPDPESFFAKFNRYRVFEVTQENDNNQFRDLLWDEPEDSVESIVITASIILVYPSSKKWAIYADRDFDFGLVGLEDENIAEKFTAEYVVDQIFCADKCLRY